MERSSRKPIRMLEKDGWVLNRIKGDHHIFKHAKVAKVISLTHPRREVTIRLVRSIYRIAGWKP